MNINKYLTPIFMIFLFCWFASCKQRQEIDNSTKLLMELLDDRQTRNTKLISNIMAMVENKGNRKSDRKIAESIKDLLAYRADKGLNQVPDQIENMKVNFDQLDTYQLYLDSIMIVNQFLQNDHEWKTHQRAIDYFQATHTLRTDLRACLNVIINFTFLEQQLLSCFNQLIDIDDFDHDAYFSFDLSSDTLKTGEEFEMIVNPRVVQSGSNVKCLFDSTQLLYNGLPYKDVFFKDISGSLYIKFTPTHSGIYELRTSLRSIYKEQLFVYQQSLEKELVAID